LGKVGICDKIISTMINFHQITIFIFLLCLSTGNAFSQDLEVDPNSYSEAFSARINFWMKVYTSIESDRGFLHDIDNPEIIYETVEIKGLSPRQVSKKVNQRKDELSSLLRSIAMKNKEDLSDEENSLLNAVANLSSQTILKKSKQIRWQQGLADNFYQGLLRSHIFLQEIKRIFREQGLPEYLAYLPHVESSFNYKAYSKVGAAGIWQFMRSTARLYRMKINYLIDERLDPLVAARSAAKLLKNNYEKIGTWPLAITAYNHGANGIAHAIRDVGSNDIEKVIQSYNGRRFGFASQNFFASFVAAYQVATHAKEYFGEFDVPGALEFFSIKLPSALRASTLAKLVGLKLSEFSDFNRAIRQVAIRRDYQIPSGTIINLPASLGSKKDQILVSMRKQVETKSEIYANSGVHIVERGETFYSISKLYKVPLANLISFNNIDNPSTIMPGEKIRIPGANDFNVTTTSTVTEQKDEEASEPFTFGPSLVEIPEFLDVNYIAKNWEQRRDFVTYSDIELDLLRGDITKDYNFELKAESKGIYSIIVEPLETLGHYSDWIGISSRYIRELNGMKGSSINLGQKFYLPIPDDKLGKFNLKRIEYHLSIEEDFYENYQVTDSALYSVKRGDSIDSICKEFEIPLWLLRKHQKNNQQMRLYVGQKLTLPVVVALSR